MTNEEWMESHDAQNEADRMAWEDDMAGMVESAMTDAELDAMADAYGYGPNNHDEINITETPEYEFAGCDE